MHKIIALSLLLLSLPAFAVICKTVDEQGNVSYSDVPASECQQQVKLPEYSRYRPRIPQAPDKPAAGEEPRSDTAPAFQGYTSVEIQQPEANGTVRDNEGRVPLSVAMEPALQSNHRLRVVLNAVQIQPDFKTQSAVLTGVERGTHTLTVHIVDTNGAVLRSALPVRFTLRKASELFEQGSGNDASDGVSNVVQGQFSSSNSTYRPGNESNTFSPANNSNSPNQIVRPPPGTAGGNHSSFRPNYSPR